MRFGVVSNPCKWDDSRGLRQQEQNKDNEAGQELRSGRNIWHERIPLVPPKKGKKGKKGGVVLERGVGMPKQKI